MACTTVLSAGWTRSVAAGIAVAAAALVVGCGGDSAGGDGRAATTRAARTSLGERVFAEHCLSCHGMTGRAATGTTGEYGPSFDHVRLRSRPYLESRLEYGGFGMQSFASELSAAEKDAVIGYVLSRSGSRVVDERLTRYERIGGARLFEQHCSTCHGIGGRPARGEPMFPGNDFGVVTPSYDLTVERTIHGYYWWMPDFRKLEERQIKAVARYVQKVAGGHPFRESFP